MGNTEDCYHLGIKALIQNGDGKILLLKVNPSKLHGEQREYWDIPGGRVQRGDSVEDTLRREILEETGLASIKVVKQLAMVLSKLRIPQETSDVGIILAIYLCEMVSDTTIKLSDEHIALGWFTAKEAADLLQVKYPKEFTEQVAALSS